MRKTHYKRAYENWDEVKAAETVGCYYCCKIQSAKNIVESCRDKNARTAICTCGIDSVVVYDAEIDGTILEFEELLKVWNKEAFKPRK